MILNIQAHLLVFVVDDYLRIHITLGYGFSGYLY